MRLDNADRVEVPALTPGGPRVLLRCRVLAPCTTGTIRRKLSRPGSRTIPSTCISKTAAVVVIYGNGRRLHADEHNHAGRLMRVLDWLGREGIPIRGMICGQRTLCRSSLRALNAYLKHGNGLAAFRRVHPSFKPEHRFAWADLQELVGLRWVFWN